MQDRPGLEKKFNIFLVEDSPLDVKLVEHGLATWPGLFELQVARDGEAASQILQQSARPAIDLLILDLNLPRKNGFEVLAEIRAHAAWCALPVVMFTTSSSEDHVLRAYQAGANAYVRKPIDTEEFQRSIQALVDFWCRAAILPRLSAL